MQSLEQKFDVLGSQVAQHHRVLFVGDRGDDSVMTQLAMCHENMARLEEIKAIVANRSWDAAKMVLAAVLGGISTLVGFFLTGPGRAMHGGGP